MIIVAGLSVDYEIEVRMLVNNPAGLDRAEIERVVGNQYNRLLRQHQNSKTLSASGGTTTADRGEKKRRPHKRFESNCFNCGRKDHRAEDCRSAKKTEKSRDAAADKGGATSVGARSSLHTNAVACAEAWSTKLAIVRSEELRRVRCWPK